MGDFGWFFQLINHHEKWCVARLMLFLFFWLIWKSIHTTTAQVRVCPKTDKRQGAAKGRDTHSSAQESCKVAKNLSAKELMKEFFSPPSLRSTPFNRRFKITSLSLSPLPFGWIVDFIIILLLLLRCSRNLRWQKKYLLYFFLQHCSWDARKLSHLSTTDTASKDNWIKLLEEFGKAREKEMSFITLSDRGAAALTGWLWRNIIITN